MAIIIRTIHNTTAVNIDLFVPGYDTIKPQVVIAPSTTVDLFTVLTTDELETIQNQLTTLVAAGDLTVIATVDTATFNPVGGGGSTSLTHLHTLAGNGSNVATDNAVLQVDITNTAVGINTAPVSGQDLTLNQTLVAGMDVNAAQYVRAGIGVITPDLSGGNDDILIANAFDRTTYFMIQDSTETFTLLQIDSVHQNTGIGGAPAVSAKLDVQSTSQGFLPPRMADPTTAITSPAIGMVAYNTTSNKLMVYTGTWETVTSA